MDPWLGKAIFKYSGLEGEYDDLTWRVATSRVEDLSELVEKALTFEKPYNLPIPIVTLAARIVFNSSSITSESQKLDAESYIRMHCNPHEEAAAMDDPCQPLAIIKKT